MMKIFDQEFALELYLNEIRVEAEAEGMAKASRGRIDESKGNSFHNEGERLSI